MKLLSLNHAFVSSISVFRILKVRLCYIDIGSLLGFRSTFTCAAHADCADIFNNVQHGIRNMDKDP